MPADLRVFPRVARHLVDPFLQFRRRPEHHDAPRQDRRRLARPGIAAHTQALVAHRETTERRDLHLLPGRQPLCDRLDEPIHKFRRVAVYKSHLVADGPRQIASRHRRHGRSSLPVHLTALQGAGSSRSPLPTYQGARLHTVFERIVICLHATRALRARGGRRPERPARPRAPSPMPVLRQAGIHTGGPPMTIIDREVRSRPCTNRMLQR